MDSPTPPPLPPAPPPGLRSDGSLSFERVGIRRSISGDLFHYLMTTSWPTLIVLLFGVWILFNGGFAALYMLDPGGVSNVDRGSFLQHFFFSVQTSATIGYGVMVPTDVYTHSLVVLEAFGGILQVACTTGVAAAKFARPVARVLWSDAMVVQERDGVPELSFRVANERGTQIMEAKVALSMTLDEVLSSGEGFRRVVSLDLVRSHTPAFVLTWTEMHRITPESPLHGLSAEDLERASVAFLVTLTGLDDTLGQTVNARTIYGWNRLRWDHRHADILSVRPDGTRVIDYAKFHNLEPVGPLSDPPR